MTRICAFVRTVVGSAFAAVPTADSLPEFIHVDGERLRTQDGADFVIQGVGVGSLRAEPVEKDYEAIAGLKFNTVTLMLSYRSFYAETDPGDYIELGWKRLDEHVAFVERLYGEFGTRREMSGIDFSPERSFFLVPDRNVVYQFYFFERDEYTHQQAPWREDRDKNLRYPELSFEIVYREALNDRGRVFRFNKQYLSFYFKRQLECGRRHTMRMFVWAFELMKNCCDGQGGWQWLRDTKALFEDYNLNWSYSDYRA